MIEELERKPCKWCGDLFYVGRTDHKFCSDFYSAERKQAIEYFRKMKLPVRREPEQHEQVGSAA